MADEVETMFSVREVPWHGLGTIVADKLTAKEAMVASGTDWDVDLFPVFARVEQERQERINPVTMTPEMVTVDLPEPKEVAVPDTFAVIRDSDLSVLGVVGGRYVPVQNWKSFEFFDQLVASGDAKYETAGSLAGGRRVFLTAKIPREIKIGGVDAHDLYLVLANSHDGSLAFTAAVTPVRVVCQNTLNLALGGRSKQQWKLRHTESIDGKIALARESLGMTFEYVDEFERQMEQLLAAPFTKHEFERMVKEVFPGPANDEGRFTDEQFSLIGVLESSPTIPDGIKQTKYGALQAIREYDDWGADIRQSKKKSIAEVRTERTWFGKNKARSDKTLQYLQAV